MQAVCSSLAAAPVACAPAKAAQAPVQAKAAVAARVAVAPKAAISNFASAKQMLVWEPTNNKYAKSLKCLIPAGDLSSLTASVKSAFILKRCERIEGRAVK